MTELQVGRLRVTIPDGGPRCGIHGTSTESGRCDACDLTRHLQVDHPHPWPEGVWRAADEAVTGCVGPLDGPRLDRYLREHHGRPAADYHDELHRALHRSATWEHDHEENDVPD